jgi:uncharacterized cupredoxin-like copper-binding protein
LKNTARVPIVFLAVPALAVAIAAGSALSAPAQTQASTATVKVALGTAAKPFALIPSPRSVRPGTVTFVVNNKSKITHEFLVLRTKRAAAKLPVKENEASEAGLLKEISEVKPGQTKRLTLTVKAGHHVLLCNLPGHYKAGQRADFNVR